MRFALHASSRFSVSDGGLESLIEKRGRTPFRQ